jgi:transcriptional regulator with XRE-family HTH domain
LRTRTEAQQAELDNSKRIQALNPEKYRHVFGEVMLGWDEQPGLLKQAGFNVSGFCSNAGITRSQFYRYRSGENFPDRVTGRKMCDVLGVTWEEFCELVVMRQKQKFMPDLFVKGVRHQVTDRRKFDAMRKATFKRREDARSTGIPDVLPPLDYVCAEVPKGDPSRDTCDGDDCYRRVTR